MISVGMYLCLSFFFFFLSLSVFSFFFSMDIFFPMYVLYALHHFTSFFITTCIIFCSSFVAYL
jgi:hypothetical protein